MHFSALTFSLLIASQAWSSTLPSGVLELTPASLGFETPAEELESTPQAYGTQGTARWGVFGDLSKDASGDHNSSLAGGLVYEFFIADDLSFNLEFDLTYFDQTGGNTWGAGAGVMLRWHFSGDDDSTYFLEGGVGGLLSDRNVPIDGSDFNFTPRAGIGFTRALEDGARLVASLRWYHISNANTYAENPGRDAAMVWVGLSWPME